MSVVVAPFIPRLNRNDTVEYLAKVCAAQIKSNLRSGFFRVGFQTDRDVVIRSESMQNRSHVNVIEINGSQYLRLVWFLPAVAGRQHRKEYCQYEERSIACHW